MKSHTPESVLLHLSLLDSVGPGVVRRILTSTDIDQLSVLYSMDVPDLMRLYDLTKKTAQRLVNGLRDTDSLHQEQELLQQHDIAWLSILDPEYPALLKEIHLPPTGIYVRGTLPTETSTLAVVGSRNANIYGQRVIDRIIPALCAQGTVIVSGGALGIDTMAHTAAVAHQSKTIAVLGAGLLATFPARYKKLFDGILHTAGALVSPFPLYMEAMPGNFPARNRIISGLSQGCLVVQAAKKSGALITARFALEQGREVFTVPGHIDDPLAAGCHNLLRQGATLVQAPEDILEFSPIFTSRNVQLSIEDEPVHQEPAHPVPVSYDSVNERLVAMCLKPISVDDLSGKLEIELFETQSRLLSLQLAGRVQQNFMGLWHT